MKVITYKEEDLIHAVQLINQLAFCGINQARIISQIGDILDSGMTGEINEIPKDQKDGEKNGVEPKKVC